MIAKFALSIFLSFLVFIVYSADRGRLPAVIAFFTKIPFGDAIGHFFLMGTFAFLVTWVLKARSILMMRLRVPLGVVVVLPVVFLEEVSQLFIPGRTFSFLDLFADLAGILLFGWLAVHFHPRQPRVLRSQSEAALIK